jgi:pilus assembly protein Flp/PilA
MKFMQIVSRFVRDEQGMETVEWGVLAALIVAGLVTVIGTLGTNVKNKFTALQNATT